MSDFEDQLIADATGVFLDTEAFGKSVTQYPRGNKDDPQTVACVFDETGLPGSGRVRGDAEAKSDASGQRTRNNATLQLLASVTTDETDRWLIDGELWESVRPLSRDAAMQAWAIVRVKQISTRRAVTRPGSR